jgi:ribose transport system substrate-binding protein
VKRWYLLLLSPLAAAILFFSLTLFYDRGRAEDWSVDGTIEIVLKSTLGQPMDFWDVVDLGVQEAAREFGVEVNSSGPRFEREIDRQISIMDRIIQEQPPVVILAASDYRGLVPSVERAQELGVPIITFDSGIDSSIPKSFIATDNIQAGRKAGAEMARLIDGHDRKQIAIVSHIRETATAIEREEGVRDALAGYDVIGTWFIDVDMQKAYRTTLELLENPELGGIVALNEVASLGVADAINERQAQGDVLVVGFDNAIRELAYLEEGVIQATVVQRPYNMGYLAVKTAVEYLNGKRVESFIDTGSVLITRENMFQREYQELLFPFGAPE